MERIESGLESLASVDQKEEISSAVLVCGISRKRRDAWSGVFEEH